MAEKKTTTPAPKPLLEFELRLGDGKHQNIKAATQDEAVSKASAAPGAVKLVARYDGKTVWKA